MKRTVVVLLSLLAMAPVAARDRSTVEMPVQLQPDGMTDRLIIKWRSTSNVHRSAALRAARVQDYSRHTGANMAALRETADGAQVVGLDQRLTIEAAAALAAQLEADPDVIYAEPDRVFYPLAIPNDSDYAKQWHYHAPELNGLPAGINLPAAWDVTTGSPDVVVAVLDTGVLIGHAELLGRTLSGYDFVDTAFVANDGDRRDNDPTDPGDWINAGQCGYGSFQASSWHGTHVAGTIGAASDNNSGVAGINWVSKILPVRVLGKCGGYESDIADGMRWAAGITVSGVPANANPAQVLNLSLGGAGACSATFQSAIDAVTAVGASVVVAAGNSDDDVAGYTPANCDGVIAVAASNYAGGIAYYSNYGGEIDIAAPGGELFIGDSTEGIYSTLDSGSTTADNDDLLEYYQGTSMAAPHVSGVISLMLSANYARTGSFLSPAAILQKLQNTARAFPSGTGSVGGDCTTSLCGAGLLDAADAVAAVTTSPTADAGADQTVAVGDSVTLSAGASADADGGIASYSWSQTGGEAVSLSNGNTTTATFTAPNSAVPLTFRVTVTDDVGLTDTDSVVITINNTIPVATDATVNILEDTSYTGTLPASDADGDALTFGIVSNGELGTATLTNSATGAFTYVPGVNVFGQDTVQFRVSDGTATSGTATLTINIAPVNDVPVLIADGVNGLVTTVGRTSVLVFDAEDPDVVGGDSVTYTVSPAILGAASFNGSQLTFIAQQAGTENLTVTLSDSAGASDSLILPVTVGAVATDSNGDGLTDEQAESLGLDADAEGGDTDQDGLADVLEVGDPAQPTDADGDGVMDVLEVGGDASDQSVLNFRVSSATAARLELPDLAGGAVRIAVANGLVLAAHNNGSTGVPLYDKAMAADDDDHEYPLGLFDFTVNAPGGTATITIHFPAGVSIPSNAVVRKRNRAGDWVTFSNATINRNSRMVVLVLTDGDSFDLNAAVGIIRDPVGIAVPVDSGEIVTNRSTGGGGGGGGGASGLLGIAGLLLLAMIRRVQRCSVRLFSARRAPVA